METEWIEDGRRRPEDGFGIGREALRVEASPLIGCRRHGVSRRIAPSKGSQISGSCIPHFRRVTPRLEISSLPAWCLFIFSPILPVWSHHVAWPNRYHRHVATDELSTVNNPIAGPGKDSDHGRRCF